MDKRQSLQGAVDENHHSDICWAFKRTGACKFDKRCRYQHPVTSSKLAKETPSELTDFFDNNGLGVSTQRIDGKLREWKCLLGNGVTISRPPPAVVSRFFKLGLELMEGDVGSSQEVIKRLANDQGLPFIKDVVERHLAVALQMGPSITFWTTEVKPLFQLITHPRVIDSSVLEQEVVTIFNFILGVGGSRMNRLFGYLALLVTKWPHETDTTSKMSVVELSLAVLSKVLDCNTSNIVNQSFAILATQFAETVAAISDEQETFATLQSVKYIDYIRRRLQVGEDIPEMSDPPRDPVVREEFVLRRDLPGTLSAEGPRHDNDFTDISKISILPTCEEITSPRAEYLPTNDSSQWHIGGIRGRLDREFRLLREDTVGQLRDTVRDVLEHLRCPQEAHSAVKNTLRTYTYENPVPMKVDFRRNGGLELHVRCSQLMAAAKLTKKQREEWWQRSRRLQAGALVCVISASGQVQFFVVSQSTLRSQSEPRFPPPKDKIASTDEGDHQQVWTLSDDPDYLFVTLRLVEDKVEDVKELLQWYGVVSNHHQQRYLVEFPGVLLDSFRHTLAALQQMYKQQDMPFSQILAPASNAGAEVVIEPALYARKPGFYFDLSCLQDGLVVSPTNLPDSIELAAVSTLDATQSAAILNTLSREISLIQGPPGTGKSYTGEKIIQVLLGNKKRAKLGPILCVCYTNHALDQLLEHLLDAGVKGVIRMGSRSKSDKMANLNLQNIVKLFAKTKEEAAKLGRAESGIKQVIQDVSRSLRELADCESWGSLKAFLLENYPHQYESIFPSEEDGWIEVTRHKPEQRFERWLHTGDDADAVPRDISILEQSDLWGMNHPERLILFEYWMKRIRDPIIRLISELHNEYSGHIEERSKVGNDLSLRCLQQANVIGLTTTGLAKNIKLLRRLRIKVLLCEEAGEVLEAHILTALLPSLEHAILIGDHLQLRPQINNYELQSTNPCGVQYSLDMSLFERLVIPPHATDPRFPFSSLETQRRMHPSISALIRPTLYPDLNDSEGVHMYPQVVGLKKRLFWMHHEQLEAGASVHDPLNTSHSNDFEVEMTTALVSHLVRQGEYQQGQIAVLTPYLDQLHRLRHRMALIFEISLNERDQDELAALEVDTDLSSKPGPPNASKSSLLKTIRIATVDNFQGEEAEIIVVSLVRSNTQNRCGFLSTPNRINVLLSRAKHGMYIIGNSNTYRSVPMWNDVINIMDAQGNIGTSIQLQCPRHPDTPILCPDIKFCQSCAPEDIKSVCVDFLEMKEYRDIDLDQDPCIFPDCGHFLTVASMDGQMDMMSHYDTDENGMPVGIYKKSEPFSMDGVGVRVCATCRGSLRNIARYGRIVRRAILDEATKKFISWSHKQYGLLSSRYLLEQEALSDAGVLGAVTARAKPRRSKSSVLRFMYLDCLEEHVLSERYGELLATWMDIRLFANDVKVDEQPFQRVADLVRHANRQHKTNKEFKFDETVIQMKGYILARTLLLKCEMEILSDFFARCNGRARLPLKFVLDFTQQFRDCEEVIQLANKSVHPKEEVQALIFEAQLCALSCKVDACSVPPGFEGGAVPGKDAVRAYGYALLERAREMSQVYPSTMIFAGEIDAVASSLDGSYRPLSKEEMRNVVEAMAGDIGTGGRWYYCENGHPFTIGECGRPMEEARCSECGAQISDRNHRLVAGVGEATELNEITRGMERIVL
ncbi:NF-X1 finger and helicase domain protein, putative [Metarhizium acridum CQMa 102]|uniref:NF-X1 finger and helicase domain protein, putative n=1 Tax=Metarhizium acridum (strain CQMa 102) TaxID=655827 RepID=E9EE31_METAQ|nr:NF-X1 finger and helicase domain protein, putative [Metarhizium acridum CQMa 102]EFY85817.1 NF-X1 finger and helicase domain protein, putative [Metarhizium acridum CQMa 102]